MKILFVLEHYLPHIGGVEIVFKNLCEGLAERGHTVKVITSKLPATPSREVINGVEVERVPVPEKMSRYFFTFMAIPRAIKDAKNFDIVHTTTFTGSFPAWVGKAVRNKPSLITVHEVWIDLWKKVTEKSRISAFIHNFLEKRIYGLSFDRYVCVSNATRKELMKQNVKKENVVTIHNGMDYEHWNPKKYDGMPVRKKLGVENNFVYFAYGRPGTSKGFEYLIKAVPFVKAEIKNSKLVLILSKDKTYSKEYEKLMELIKNLNVKEDIIVIEPVGYKELPNYVMMADCIVIPSLSEGFGYACVEACSLGKAVVASNTTSLPEVISGRGKLVEAGDEKAIAQGIIDISKGKADVFREKKFLWKDAIDKYEKVYKELINEKRS